MTDKKPEGAILYALYDYYLVNPGSPGMPLTDLLAALDVFSDDKTKIREIHFQCRSLEEKEWIKSKLLADGSSGMIQLTSEGMTVAESGRKSTIQENPVVAESGDNPPSREKPVAPHIHKFSPEFQRKLVSALIKCPIMRDNESRNTVINQLPDRIKASIREHNNPMVHVSNIVRACINFEKGMETLVNAVRFFDDGTYQMQAVDRIVDEQ